MASCRFWQVRMHLKVNKTKAIIIIIIIIKPKWHAPFMDSCRFLFEPPDRLSEVSVWVTQQPCFPDLQSQKVETFSSPAGSRGGCVNVCTINLGGSGGQWRVCLTRDRAYNWKHTSLHSSAGSSPGLRVWAGSCGPTKRGKCIHGAGMRCDHRAVFEGCDHLIRMCRWMEGRMERAARQGSEASWANSHLFAMLQSDIDKPWVCTTDPPLKDDSSVKQ